MAVIIIAETYPILRIGIREFLQDKLKDVVVIDMEDNVGLESTMKATPADLIILDGDKSGKNTIGELHRINAKWPKTKVMVYEERKRDIPKTPFLQEGATAYLEKESTADDFINMVKQCLVA